MTNTFIPDYYVYTDGSCTNNGKPNAKCGTGVYFEENDPRNLSKSITGKTNNIAELTAILYAFNIIKEDLDKGKKIIIYTDSKYSILCLTTYGAKCEKKQWSEDIPNKLLVKELFEIYKNYKNVKIMHIKAHTDLTDIHSIGNFNADKLANLSIDNTKEYKKDNKIYLKVSFLEKDLIKKLGGLWDMKKKKWYILEDNKNKEEIFKIFSIYM